MSDKPASERDLYDLPLWKRFKLFAAAGLLLYPVAPLTSAYLSYNAGQGFDTADWGMPWWMFAIVLPGAGLALFGAWVRDMQQLKEDRNLHLDTLAAILGLGFLLSFLLSN